MTEQKIIGLLSVLWQWSRRVDSLGRLNGNLKLVGILTEQLKLACLFAAYICRLHVHVFQMPVQNFIFLQALFKHLRVV